MFDRYAIYYTPPEGALAEALADWLGWDATRGADRQPPVLAGLPRPAAALTDRPRKYGAHGTLKPPFHLAPGCVADELTGALYAFAAGRAPVWLDGLEVTRIGRFLALVPRGDTRALADLAAATVQQFDRFRAPPTAEALARRRKARLSPRQEANLIRWGYPHVMEDFRFHITLTGPLRPEEFAPVTDALTRHLAPLLPAPFAIEALSLLGADAATGRFHLIRRAPLTG
ncbi:putative phosphonate metabolism protein [Marinovum algicola DG 898]|nr:putative phosphonate metabolism protein [Marinovum algicola DG 898]